VIYKCVTLISLWNYSKMSSKFGGSWLGFLRNESVTVYLFSCHFVAFWEIFCNRLFC
jgi:hypothetical protein